MNTQLGTFLIHKVRRSWWEIKQMAGTSLQSWAFCSYLPQQLSCSLCTKLVSQTLKRRSHVDQSDMYLSLVWLYCHLHAGKSLAISQSIFPVFTARRLWWHLSVRLRFLKIISAVHTPSAKFCWRFRHYIHILLWARGSRRDLTSIVSTQNNFKINYQRLDWYLGLCDLDTK